MRRYSFYCETRGVTATARDGLCDRRFGTGLECIRQTALATVLAVFLERQLHGLRISTRCRKTETNARTKTPAPMAGAGNPRIRCLILATYPTMLIFDIYKCIIFSQS